MGLQIRAIFEKNVVRHSHPLKVLYDFCYRAEKVRFKFLCFHVPLASRSDTIYNHLPGG